VTKLGGRFDDIGTFALLLLRKLVEALCVNVFELRRIELFRGARADRAPPCVARQVCRTCALSARCRGELTTPFWPKSATAPGLLGRRLIQEWHLPETTNPGTLFAWRRVCQG
jgi:hypothetical protein